VPVKQKANIVIAASSDEDQQEQDVSTKAEAIFWRPQNVPQASQKQNQLEKVFVLC